MRQEKHDCVIVGDFNHDVLKNTSIIREYLHVGEVNAFQIQNDLNTCSPTWSTSTTTTILDHIWANNNIGCTIKMEDHFATDHKVIMVDIQNYYQKKKKSKNTKKDFKWSKVDWFG